MVKPIGLVLAGGTGRRMGRAKGDLRLGRGPTLALRAAEALAPVCRGVLISVRPGSNNPAPGFPAIEDSPPPGRGPLAGIEAGFGSTHGAGLLVLACDYPYAKTDLLRRLSDRAGDQHDVVMVVGGDGRDHPLVAVWSDRTRSRVREALEQGTFGVRKLIAGWRLLRLGPTEFPGIDLDASMVNVNTEDDLRRP